MRRDCDWTRERKSRCLNQSQEILQFIISFQGTLLISKLQFLRSNLSGQASQVAPAAINDEMF